MASQEVTKSYNSQLKLQRVTKCIIDSKIDHLASQESTWDSTESGTRPKVASNLMKMPRTPCKIARKCRKLQKVTQACMHMRLPRKLLGTPRSSQRAMRADEKLERTKILVKPSESAKSNPNPTEIKANPTEIKPNQVKSNQNHSKLKPEAKSNQIQAKPNQTKSNPKPATQARPSLEPAEALSQPWRHGSLRCQPGAAPVAPHIRGPCRGGLVRLEITAIQSLELL